MPPARLVNRAGPQRNYPAPLGAHSADSIGPSAAASSTPDSAPPQHLPPVHGAAAPASASARSRSEPQHHPSPPASHSNGNGNGGVASQPAPRKPSTSGGAPAAHAEPQQQHHSDSDHGAATNDVAPLGVVNVARAAIDASGINPPSNIKPTAATANNRQASTTNAFIGYFDSDDEDMTDAERLEARTVVNTAQIQAAYGRIRKAGLKLPTPVGNATHLVPGFKSVHVKQEQLHRTGSFKERGALSNLLLLTPAEREIGVVTASAGNHSSAVAYHAQRLGIPFKCFMPTIAPLSKVQLCLSFGAEVEIVGDNLEETRNVAQQYAKETNRPYIHGFAGAPILNGAGSCGIEILEQCPDTQVIIVPAGGCGLLAGVAAAVKNRNPHCKVVAVESVACPGFADSRKAGKVVRAQLQPTLCDGVHVPVIGALSFEVANPLVDEAIVVEERYVVTAMVLAMEKLKVVLEGSAALGIAAMLSGQLDHYKKNKIVVILSGGNLDMTSVSKVIERALLLDKRYLRVRCEISDSPGSIASFLAVIANVGGSIKDIQQERGTRAGVYVRLQIETRGADHAREVCAKLKEKGYDVVVQEAE